jgi:hypothetical protein
MTGIVLCKVVFCIISILGYEFLLLEYIVNRNAKKRQEIPKFLALELNATLFLHRSISKGGIKIEVT